MNAHYRVTLLPSLPLSFIHNKSHHKGGARGVMVIVVRHEFKSWTRLIALLIALIPLGKV